MAFQSMGMNADDAQLLESRGFSVAEVARLFGVPPHMIGDLSRSTSWGTGIEAQTFAFITYALLPWLVIWQECLEAVLVQEKDVHIRFSVGKLMQADMQTRFNVYNIGIDAGIYSPNECREFEDMNPREGGDEYRKEPKGNASGAAQPFGKTPMPPMKPAQEPMDDPAAENAAAAMLTEQDDRVKALAAVRAGAAALGVPDGQVRKLLAAARPRERTA
jgi:hypothetical protein